MDQILQALGEIERLKQIKIVYACETGSRAWGFPSPDSDYDIRFIYKYDKDWYLQLGQRKDTVEIMSGELDITGWDLRKSLMLLKKSNTALIERFQSPILYRNLRGFRNDFSALIREYYSARAVYFHHYFLAIKFWEEMKDQQQFKLKNYFYLLRSLLSCNWIMNDGSVPPMHIEGLMQYIGDEDRGMIRELIRLKADKNESYVHDSTKDQRRLITHLLKTTENKGESLPVCREDFSKLNSFFIKQLDATDDK